MKSEIEIRQELDEIKKEMDRWEKEGEICWKEFQSPSFPPDSHPFYERWKNIKIQSTLQNEKRRLLCWVLGEEMGK